MDDFQGIAELVEQIRHGRAFRKFQRELVVAQPVLAANGVCLTVRNIADSQASKDGTSITFKMRDGELWHNDLKGNCPDLWFNGFSMVEHTDTICENEPGRPSTVTFASGATWIVTTNPSLSFNVTEDEVTDWTRPRS